MQIAIMGTRGVPAAYGGFETFAEELGARLVERGHDVTVYGRSHVVPSGTRVHRGMRIRILPTIRHKYLDTVAHTALSVVDGLFRGYDAVLICNNANAPFAIVPRLAGARVVLNVDGLEWQRGKWNAAGRLYYQTCAWLSPKLPIALVTDARVIADWYMEQYGRRTPVIPYGSDSRRLGPGPALADLGIEPGRYLLYVSRLEPENNADVAIEGYRMAGGLAALGVPLIVVGDAPYASAYKATLTRAAAATPGVVMTGYVFGDGYAELQSNALAYIQATEVGGTHPALVEAMGRGAVVIANDVPEHREVLADAGAYYRRNDPGSLAETLHAIVGDEGRRARLSEQAAARASALFSWERVTADYERLFERLVRR
jgi:glycosyltransferase involved in cell wall biosynthesis